MNRILLISAILFSTFLNVNAQTSKQQFNVAPPLSAMSAYALPLSTESKTFKKFRRAYPQVTNEKWSVQDEHYIVSFVDDNIKYKIVYTRSGQIDYSLKIYTEKELPSTVRNAVKSSYYDYSITNAQELHVGTQTIYLVKITDGDTWKYLRLGDGNMEEIENYYNVISPCR